MKNKLSVVMITFNSEKYLEKSLGSALFADEVLILDSGSTDSTIQIAKTLGVKVYQEKWRGFGLQKQRAVELAKNDWIFVLDSDEVITEELKNEILSVLESPKFKGYFVPRLNYFFGKPVKRCGLYPDYTLRLFNRKYGRFTQDEVHEKVILSEKPGKLKNHMIHYAYDTIEEFVEKQNRYSTLGAKPGKLKAVFSPVWTFLNLYFFKLGFLEGWRGFVISALYSQYTFLKYIKGSIKN
ncbi:MAG: glycosyltransferase family 2 protein [Thermodesulfobacteria bacterium]|nr:glycosyltransferase family 2 protein [Thermodesulfobacteriota bacterium]